MRKGTSTSGFCSELSDMMDKCKKHHAEEKEADKCLHFVCNGYAYGSRHGYGR